MAMVLLMVGIFAAGLLVGMALMGACAAGKCDDCAQEELAARSQQDPAKGGCHAHSGR